jgi:signal transduction histidine kinase
MNIINLYKKSNKFLYSILEIGTKEISSISIKQRIIYFNAILLSLPIVYLVFVLRDIQNYLRPINSWYFDQYGFFIFVTICLFCFYFNKHYWSNYSKILFILSWPLVLHIAPIIIQTTPNDYYYAFPIGVIFHSVLIQIIFNKKNSPWQFWIFLIANFITELNFLKILLYFDGDGKTDFIGLESNEYYVLVVILYWLLFNLIINYLLGIIDSKIFEISNSLKIIEKQKDDLEETLDKLQESNTQIIRSEKMTSLGILTAGVAHEINNPLNFIMSGLFNLEAHLKKEQNTNKPEKIKLLLESIETGVGRISNIVNSLNQFSRDSLSNNEYYNIHNIIENCLKFLNNKTLNRIKIKKNYFNEPISMLGNIGELHQMFISILNNSIQAIENKGIIFIKTQKYKEKIVIEISDTGCGIREENIPKITDPFFTTKDPGKGTGLGLSIVYKIIQDHKGKLEFQSVVNKGTVVKITLPIIQ